jgi:hypothetical protein
VIDHLVDYHNFDRSGNKRLLKESRKRKQGSLEGWSQQAIAHNTVFDNVGWKAAYTRWFVSSGISLRQASSVEHNDLLCFQNPRIKDLVPRSYTTTSSWLMAEYERHKPTIVQSIANAKSKLTISFDRWKANNDVLDLLRVVVHYLGDDYKLHNVVLAMRDTLGSHTGANIADQLFDVLKDYQISGSQIAYFAADNATNNDTALVALAERVDINPIATRLRCAGHIFNLMCSAILFSVDDEAIADAQYDYSQQEDDSPSGTQVVEEFETVLQHGSEEEKHIA